MLPQKIIIRWINYFNIHCVSFFHSKFKQKLTSVHRRSAFCIFHPIKSSAKFTETQSSAPINLARSKTQRAEIDVVVADDNNKTTKSTITCNKINNNNIENNNRRKRGTKLQQQENVIDECTASKRTKPSTVAAAPKKGNSREKIRQLEKQEKEDFKLAKMLQEYDDNAHSPSSNRTMRYALRSRSKPSSSLSSSSSSIENIQNKFALMTTTKQSTTKKNCTFTSELGKTLRSGSNKSSILSFNDQKLTRSRRLALAITGA